jgi:hypothetical protein
MIEETKMIRLGLLYPNWLPIAETFNHKSSICGFDFGLHKTGRVRRVKPAVDSLVLFIDESSKLVEKPIEIS